MLNNHLLKYLSITSRRMSSDSDTLHTHGVGACWCSRRLEDMFTGSLRQINTDSRTTQEGDFMQMNQHDILLGAVAQCTISVPVSLLFIASRVAQG